jgi:hypothetical protein
MELVCEPAPRLRSAAQVFHLSAIQAAAKPALLAAFNLHSSIAIFWIALFHPKQSPGAWCDHLE